MGAAAETAGANLVKVRHETRSKRMRRQRLLKAGVWIFLCIFAFSVVGGLMFVVVSSTQAPAP